MGQNRIRGGGGVKNRQKSSDIIYVRSLIVLTTQFENVQNQARLTIFHSEISQTNRAFIVHNEI